MLFIPQKTYLTDGTLREQLAYPDGPAAADALNLVSDDPQTLWALAWLG